MLFYLFIVKKIRTFMGDIEVFMVNNNRAGRIAKYAVVFAIIFIAMMIDKAISVIPIGFSMAACVLLVTLTFCFLDNTWLSAILSGLFFGFASFLKEFILPSPTLGAAFPVQYWLLVTIPSRILMVVAAFATYRLLLHLTDKMSNAKTRQVICLVCASFVGLVVNTLTFVGSLELARYIYNAVHGWTEATDNKGVFTLIYALLVTNIIPEYLISMICVSPIVFGVRRGLKLGIDGNNQKHAANAVDVASPDSDVAQDETDNIADSQN